MLNILKSLYLHLLILINCAIPSNIAVSAERSFTARNGHALFETEHLVPSLSFNISQYLVDKANLKVVALTFDDGPDPQNDTTILKILADNHLHATFFFIGKKLIGKQALITQLMANGNEIANHSYYHPMMTDISAAVQDSNIQMTNSLLYEAGVAPHWFRPPYGDFDQTTVSIAKQHGLDTVLWTIDSQDWKNTKAEIIIDRVISRIHSGAIILFHSTKPETVKALPHIIATLKHDGYSFVTMSEWRSELKKLPKPSIE